MVTPPYNQYITVNPGSGFYQDIDWSKIDATSLEQQRRQFAIPNSLSKDLTEPSGGFEQQTFLGASIRSFTCNAGYGDTSSTLNVELVNDEYNVSDKTPRGTGHDVYHSGTNDNFAPPQVGSPVFFQFGKKRSSVQNTFLKVYDDIYEKKYAEETGSDGQFHFTFGGILQSYVQNRGAGGNPLYSIQVTDPREILSNTSLILNNYTGTTYDNKNMFNIYGFLEYNPTLNTKNLLEGAYPVKDILEKKVKQDGSYTLEGIDLYAQSESVLLNEKLTDDDALYSYDDGAFPVTFPITGTGFSRRCDQGMPYYRIRQALETLMYLNGPIPSEYQKAGFGGMINFRGFNYLVDLSGLKRVHPYYFFDFDHLNLLDFCLEICDITSSDLFVSLLPIIDHPVCKRFYDWNVAQMSQNNPKNFIAGIIRVDSIDRSFQPQYGAIKKYIDSLPSSGVFVQNQDVGFELSNVTTDKFLVGAQEVDMYYFSGNNDRDTLQERKKRFGLPSSYSALQADQWRMERMLKQQIIPYYGLLGNKAVSIPKGFGSYQQILLDSSSLFANGVGNYYVATEMELRCALVSFERWEEFLLEYNDKYMESTELNDIAEGAALSQTAKPANAPPHPVNLSNNYAVTVPRCVFVSDNNSFGKDGLPINASSPPYGYPLYYKRATKFGVQAAGLVEIQDQLVRIVTSSAVLNGTDNAAFEEMLNSELKKFKSLPQDNLTQAEREYILLLEGALNNGSSKYDVMGLIEKQQNNMAKMFRNTGRLARKTRQNALKIYNFIKSVADECLGKKFLVKIPREVNVYYDKTIESSKADEYKRGPFGFKPRNVNSNFFYDVESSGEIEANKQEMIRLYGENGSTNMIEGFLTLLDPNPTLFQGALNVNFNPLMDRYEYNYTPSKQGGFVNFDLFTNYVNQKNNLAISQGLLPIDLTNFMMDNSRICPYVRFDHSENLDFGNVGSDNFTQQEIKGGFFIPDISSSLDNTDPANNQFESFPKPEDLANEDNQDKQNPSIAFMKCDVEERLFMTPKFVRRNVNVYGGKVKDVGSASPPNKIWNASICSFADSFTYWQAQFVPDSNFEPNELPEVEVLDYQRNADLVKDGEVKKYSIETKLENLDDNNVYALITLPTRVVSTIDARFRDGPYQLSNADRLKHYLGMDVVKLPEFSNPGYRGIPSSIFNDPKYNSILDPKAIGYAIAAYNKAMDSVDVCYPNKINVLFPSPIYPDLVALPLMSKDRCYGPWISSQLDLQSKIYSEIPGKVEFIKDENLAPWNFNGYDLLNDAGRLQAEFSNSLLLSSERGGFTVPSAPSGIYLGKFLANAGPLVTNISVDISNNGINTTYKMDLYTSSFGKLQKQKSDIISNVSRERQKLRDEKNSATRKGIGKNQTNVNYNLLYQNIRNATTIDVQVVSLPRKNKPNNIVSASVKPSTQNVHVVNPGNTMSNGFNYAQPQRNVSVTSQNDEDLLGAFEDFPSRLQAQQAFYNSAAVYEHEDKTPVSKEPGHRNMSYMPPRPQQNGFVSMLLDPSDEQGNQYSVFDS